MILYLSFLRGREGGRRPYLLQRPDAAEQQDENKNPGASSLLSDWKPEQLWLEVLAAVHAVCSVF